MIEGAVMHKIVIFLRFRDDVDRAEAERRFAGPHAELVLEVPGLLRYVQNPVVTAATLAGADDEQSWVDAFVAMWFADGDGLAAALESPQWAAAGDDAAEIFDVEFIASGWAAEIEERVKREGLGAPRDGVGTPPRGPIKLIGILRYRADMDRDECNRYWATTHGDIALTISQIGHYTQNHAIRPLMAPALAFDGFSESWYADEATYREAMASPEWERLGADGDNLFDMGDFKSVIVEECVLRG
jgi:uncharacterized protein (TIGR02118 family)